jgi:hypothetical protein
MIEPKGVVHFSIADAGCATLHFSAARVKFSSWQRVKKYLT